MLNLRIVVQAVRTPHRRQLRVLAPPDPATGRAPASAFHAPSRPGPPTACRSRWRAKLDDGRRGEGEDHGVAHLRQRRRSRLSRRRRSLLVPRIDQSFRLAKPRAVFWPRPLKLKPATVKMPFTLSFSSFQIVALHRLDSFERALHRGTRRQRYWTDQDALVLVGQERGRQAQEQHAKHRPRSADSPEGRRLDHVPDIPVAQPGRSRG